MHLLDACSYLEASTRCSRCTPLKSQWNASEVGRMSVLEFEPQGIPTGLGALDDQMISEEWQKHQRT